MPYFILYLTYDVYHCHCCYLLCSFHCVQGSPDLKAAREVADYIGTVHGEFHFIVQVAYLSRLSSTLVCTITFQTCGIRSVTEVCNPF